MEPTAAGFAENTMLEPTAAAKARFYECLEEPEVTAGYEVGAEKETVAVPVAAENEVEAAVAGREQVAHLLCWQQHLEAAIEAEMTSYKQEQASNGGGAGSS